MVMFCGFSIGAAAGGFASAALIETFGWRSIFIVGGVLPCVLAVVAAVALPESIRFLTLKGGRERQLKRYVAKIAPESRFDDGVSFAVAEQAAQSSTVGQLFAAGRTPVTLLIWVIFFMSLLTLYFLNNWLPTIMTEAGIRLETAAVITAMFQVGGTVGALTLGRRIDRYLSFNVLAAAYGGACLAVFAIGAAGAGLWALVTTIFIAGFCVIGGQAGSNALAADFYPTAIRSTGVGWALGIGRIGSILGPFVGGYLLSSVTETRHVFWVVAMPTLLAMAAALAVAALRQKQLRTAAELSA
jgi:AAHS family 4-hydroxybenzoate transporter-like MFS transporter